MRKLAVAWPEPLQGVRYSGTGWSDHPRKHFHSNWKRFRLEVMRGVEAELAHSPYTLLVRTIEGADDRERVFGECCRRTASDGVLVVWVRPTEQFTQRVADEGLLPVLMNAVDPRLWSVAVNHAVAAEQAVTYCLERGHRRIALVDRLEDPFDPASGGICEHGYRETMAA